MRHCMMRCLGQPGVTDFPASPAPAADPVIKIAIEPKTKQDLEKMGMGLAKLAQEDPSFGFSRDEETGQTVRGAALYQACYVFSRVLAVDVSTAVCSFCCILTSADDALGHQAS